MRLGEILQRLGLITPQQLETGLRTQKFLGGRLGTHLVELGFVGTDQVSDALGRQMGIPAALERHLSRADSAVVQRLKGPLAARYMTVPLLAPAAPHKPVVVTMATPLDMPTVDEMAFALGARVEPLVSAELAIARSLKRLYGVEVNLKTRKPRAAAPEAAELRRPAEGPQKPITIGRGMGPLTPPPAEQILPPVTPPPAPAQTALVTPVSLQDTIHRISAAEHRDQVADILLDFLIGRFGCGMIFRLHSGTAKVWRGFAPDVQPAAVETIAFPIAMPSCFQIAHDRQALFHGPPPHDGAKLQGQIWSYLHCQAPSDVLVAPIMVKNRVVTLIYGHGADGSDLPAIHVADVQALLPTVSSAYVRMIQQLKSAASA